MKILEQTPTELTIQHKPTGAWSLGAVMSGVGLSLIMNGLGWSADVVQLRCDRYSANSVVCPDQRSTPVGISSQPTIVDVEFTQGVESHSQISRSSIEVVNVSEPAKSDNFDSVTETNSEIQTLLDQAKLASNRQSSRFDNTYLLVSSGSIILLTSLWFLTMSVTTCGFYKSLDKIIIQKNGLLGKRKVEYSLQTFQQATIEETRTRHARIYRIILWFEDEKKVPMTRDRILNRQSLETILTEIQAFLR